jgi:hypothetical protein
MFTPPSPAPGLLIDKQKIGFVLQESIGIAGRDHPVRAHSMGGPRGPRPVAFDDRLSGDYDLRTDRAVEAANSSPVRAAGSLAMIEKSSNVAADPGASADAEQRVTFTAKAVSSAGCGGSIPLTPHAKLSEAPHRFCFGRSRGLTATRMQSHPGP